jgi:hypothetical protein
VTPRDLRSLLAVCLLPSLGCGEARPAPETRVATTPSAAPSNPPPVVASAPPSTTTTEPAPSAAPVASAVSDEPPAVAPATLDKAAHDAFGKISAITPGKLGAPEKSCPGGACYWKWSIDDATGNSLGTIQIEETTSTLTYVVNDGNGIARAVDAYVQYDKDSKRALAAIATLPEAKGICAQVNKDGAGCSEYVSDDSGGPCSSGTPAPPDACLWGVYVGSNMGTHLSRLATFWIEPRSFTVIAVSDAFCDKAMPLATFRAREKLRASGKTVDTCP